MEWFEKEYKKRFEEDSSLEGINSDALWSQITESIPQKKSNLPYWRWSLLAVLLIGAAVTWISIQNDNTSTVTPTAQSNVEVQHKGNQSTKTNIAENINVNTQDVNIKNADEIENENTESSSNNTTERNDIKGDKSLAEISIIDNNNKVRNTEVTPNSVGKINESITTKRDILTAQSNTKVNIKSNQSINTNTESKPKNRLGNESKTAQNSNLTPELSTSQADDTSSKNLDAQRLGNVENDEPKSIDNESILKSSKSRELIEVSEISESERSVLSVINDLDRQDDIDIPSVSPPKVTIEKRNPLEISVQTSMNFFDLKYSDDQNAELFASDANESLGAMQIGSSVAINMEYQLNRSWSIGTGIELNNYENKLDVVLTSDTTKFDGQKLRRAKYTRTVNHHNKLSTFTIPMSISYEYSISDRLSLGASLGASYSLIRSQRGRILGRNDMILDYSDEENRQFDNFLSLRINPFLKYDISEKLTLSINAGISMQNHGKAEIQDLKQNSMIYNIGLGLQYKM